MSLLCDFTMVLWPQSPCRQTVVVTLPRGVNYIGNAHQGLLSVVLDLQR